MLRFLQTLLSIYFLNYIWTFILYYNNMQNIPLLSVTLLQNDQNEEHTQQSQTYVFCFAEYTIFTESTQAIAEALLYFAKVPSV